MNQVKPFFYCILICLTATKLCAQAALTKGDVVENIPIKKVVNSIAVLSSLESLPTKLTIVDFFGTWCVPCLRALPGLTALKNRYGPDLNIILVSNETEAQLKKFVQNKDRFPFPIIVDEENEWTTRFQPPSLPYTVVVKDKKIIAITEAEKIDSTMVESWLRQLPAEIAKSIPVNKTANPMVAGNTKSSNQTVQLSQAFLYAVKTGDNLQTELDSLKTISYSHLLHSLATDNQKKAFWINIYNGFVQAMLKENPEQYHSRSSFFKKKNIAVAAEVFSLDDIEHGILRHSKIKWSLGYLNKFFPSKREKSLRVEKLDYRIHFALNCGAKSCPPIAFYNDETLDAQLDLATKAYLSGEATFDSASGTVWLPQLMSWFRRDFGGKKGMLHILRKFEIIPKDAAPKIRFKDYDWTLSLQNYTNQNP
jgi:thiol-disulfide isomerase/thioredoxin